VNHIEDTLTVVADLQPASLDRLAEDGYARRRAGDLARLTAEPARPGRLARPGRPGRRRLLAASSVAGLAAAAAAVAAVTLTSPSAPGPGTAPPGPGSGGAPVSVDAHTVLLASARVAAHAPAATGTYWYVKERDFEPASPQKSQKKFSRPTEPPYRAFFAATQETWFGQTSTRTTVNEDLAFNFASPADKARWQAAGSPKLSTPAGFGYRGPVTSDYNFGGYSYSIGALQVSLVKARTLPATAAGLGALLRDQWDKLSVTQRAATVGFPKPTYAQYVYQVATALLTGPVTSGTRAAVYELLADQPGLSFTPHVTDPLGRVGAAIGDGEGDYLIIDPATAMVLAQTTYPVRQGRAIPATAAGTEAYEAMGWTSQLGTPAVP
jgi:hypothetical protein